MKSTLSLSLGLILSSVSTVLASKGESKIEHDCLTIDTTGGAEPVEQSDRMASDEREDDELTLSFLRRLDLSSDRLIRRHSAFRPRQYGGAGAAYGGGGGADTGSAVASDMVLSPALDISSSEMMASESMMDSSTVSAWSETSTAMAEQPESTWSAASASASSGWQYGSGSYGKNQGAYNDCVQQCKAKYAGEFRPVLS